MFCESDGVTSGSQFGFLILFNFFELLECYVTDMFTERCLIPWFGKKIIFFGYSFTLIKLILFYFN